MNGELQAAILSIYDAQIDESKWVDVVDQCQLYVKSKGSALLVVDGADTFGWQLNVASSLWRGVEPAIVEQAAKFSHYDAAAYQALTLQPRHSLGIDYEAWPDVDLWNREDYAYYRKHAGVYRRVASRLNDNKAWMDCITFQYDQSEDVVSTASQQRIRELLPHVAKSIEMGRGWRELKARHNAVLAALDNVAIGLVVISDSHQVIITNKQADSIFDAGDGIAKTSSGKLAAFDAEADSELQLAITHAAQTAAGLGDSSEKLLTIPRRRKDCPAYVAEVFPLRDAYGELDNSDNFCMLTLIDPNETSKISVEAMSRVYGLSEAETAVSKLVVEGKTNTQIGEIRNVSVETVKSQVVKVLSKTNCVRRSDLIRLACKTTPPIVG